MSRLREIVADVRRIAPAPPDVSDAEIARIVGDVCSEMLAESVRERTAQREWRDEITARAVERVRAKRIQ